VTRLRTLNARTCAGLVLHCRAALRSSRCAAFAAPGNQAASERDAAATFEALDPCYLPALLSGGKKSDPRYKLRAIMEGWFTVRVDLSGARC
jgi:hypothetical protein